MERTVHTILPWIDIMDSEDGQVLSWRFFSFFGASQSSVSWDTTGEDRQRMRPSPNIVGMPENACVRQGKLAMRYLSRSRILLLHIMLLRMAS